MKFRFHNEKNISKTYTFHTYFKTKKEAVAYASQMGGGIIERKIGGAWFECATVEMVAM
jgi:hypothetical protein